VQEISEGVKHMWRYVKAYFAAVIMIYLLGSIAITQMNLASLQELGASVPWPVRLNTTWLDLQGLLMPYLVLVSIAALLAFLVTGQISRFFPTHRVWLYALAGFVALLAMHLILKAVLGLWGVAGARPMLGLLLQGVAGALGGWAYAHWSRRPSTIFID
jgi:hypothetical protein